MEGWVTYIGLTKDLFLLNLFITIAFFLFSLDQQFLNISK